MSYTRERGDHRRRDLASGEVSDRGVSTTVLPAVRRVGCASRLSRGRAVMGSSAVMAERRHCSTATRHCRACQGAMVCARAPRCEGDHGVLDKRERERAEGDRRRRPVARPWRGGAMADSASHLNAGGCEWAHEVEDVEAEPIPRRIDGGLGGERERRRAPRRHRGELACMRWSCCCGCLRERARQGRRWRSEGEGARPDQQNGRSGRPPPLAAGAAARHAACTGAGKAGTRPCGREQGGAGLGRLRLMGRKRGCRPKIVFLFFNFI
jgi:hypothetical protein